MDTVNSEKQLSIYDRPLPFLEKRISIDLGIFLAIVILAIISRFAGLGNRPLSHDEGIHLFYSYIYSIGQGYLHTPVSHGPLQFHILAFLFTLFGTSDFIGRIPHALASIITIVLLWKWRRYLGRFGTLIAAGMMLISPYFLYYGRYARNETFVALLGVLTFYSILRYFETGQDRYLLFFTIVTALHFTVKETAFIYTAQAMVFLGVFLLHSASTVPWQKENYRRWFQFTFTSCMVLLFLSLFALFLGGTSILGESTYEISRVKQLASLLGALTVVFIVIAIINFLIGHGWNNLKNERAFTLLILLGIFVLPLLTAIPATWLGLNPMDYHLVWSGWDILALLAQAPIKTGILFFLLCLTSVVVCMLWNRSKLLPYLGIFWGIYILFYTSLFSNPAGFFTGTIGSLGYWLEQQSVHRGNQPWYYYALVQIPIYEYLPALGSIVACYFGFSHKPQSAESQFPPFPSKSGISHPQLFPLLFWWACSSLLFYSLAGEKMPWLTIHIVLPMILLSGWGIERVIDSIVRTKSNIKQSYLAFVLFLVLLISFLKLGINWLGSYVNTTVSISNIQVFYGSAVVVSGVALYKLVHRNSVLLKRVFPIGLVSVLCLFGLLTVRTAIRATYINDDNAEEYLIYAHGSQGIINSLLLIETLSQRIDGGEQNISIMFDAGGETQGVSWPWKWYMRTYLNSHPYFSADDSLLSADVIVADPQSYDEVDAITAGLFTKYNSIRMVWPNQDYFDLTWERLTEILQERNLVKAIYNIWSSRDYKMYAGLTGETGFDLPKWNPRDSMKIYFKNDLLGRFWELNILGFFQSHP